jgi:hypothetical protein
VKRVGHASGGVETAVALIVPFQQPRRFGDIEPMWTAILMEMAHRARAFFV